MCIFTDLRALKLDISTMAMEMWWQLKSAWESFQHLLFVQHIAFLGVCDVMLEKNKVFLFCYTPFICVLVVAAAVVAHTQEREKSHFPFSIFTFTCFFLSFLETLSVLQFGVRFLANVNEWTTWITHWIEKNLERLERKRFESILATHTHKHYADDDDDDRMSLFASASQANFLFSRHCSFKLFKKEQTCC